VSPPAPHQEIEWKLTTRDSSVLDDLAGRDELAGYELRSSPPRQLSDQYWDTPDRRLSACDWGLRIRVDDGLEQFTIKRAASRQAGLFQRDELELPATPENWAEIRAQLESAGVPLEGDHGVAGPPSVWLASAGLVRTQERSTQRRIRIAIQQNQHLAELALDLSTYYLGAYEVTFREVEVEALTPESRHVDALARALLRQYGERVRPSLQGKYSLGLALAAALAPLQP
jgi:inorganic triphosphatase YgiF